jgi:hypothetical protein
MCNGKAGFLRSKSTANQDFGSCFLESISRVRVRLAIDPGVLTEGAVGLESVFSNLPDRNPFLTGRSV